MRIPGPWLAKYTKWWFRWFEVKGVRYNILDLYKLDTNISIEELREETIESLHKRYGSVVQIAPRVVSINNIKNLPEVYSVARKWDREPLPIFHTYGSDNLISTVDGNAHHERRKPMRRLYGKRAIDSSEMQGLFREKARQFVRYCVKEAQTSETIDVKGALRLMCGDIMSAIVYGDEFALNLLGDQDQRSRMAADFKWQHERLISLSGALSAWFPTFVMRLRAWKLAPYPLHGIPPEALLMNQTGKRALKEALEASSKSNKQPNGALMETLVDHYLQQSTPLSEKYILSECLDHFWAGVDTTTDALLALIFQVSLPRNIERQRRLRRELNKHDLNDDRANLGFLNCVVKESLRLDPPIAGLLDRITDADITIDGINIPPGTEIGAQPYSLHRNPEVFPSPDTWKPERWEVDSGSEEYRAMNRHLFAFGAGPRMCIGMNVALSVMRHSVASLYGAFGTLLPDEFLSKQEDEQEKKMKTWIRGDLRTYSSSSVVIRECSL